MKELSSCISFSKKSEFCRTLYNVFSPVAVHSEKLENKIKPRKISDLHGYEIYLTVSNPLARSNTQKLDLKQVKART